MQQAVVTGAGGFLGRYIAEMLQARGVQVVGLGRGTYPQLLARGITTVCADIRDRAAVERACAGADIVFHTAAIAGIWGRWSDYYQINAVGTENVIAACRVHGIRRLVFTSSPSVTFGGKAQCGVNESEPYPRRWLSHYSHSKALAEQSVLAANDTELATCALRPHLIFGPRDPHLIPRLLERARAGQLRQVGAGTNLIDVTYVENAAEAHLLAAEKLSPGSAVAGRAYFLSQGEPVLCWAWINQILERAGLPAVTRRISFSAAWFIGGVLEATHQLTGHRTEPRMTRFLAAQLALPHYFDISAAQRDFGYQPRVSTAAGVERLVASWRDSHS